MKHAVIAAGLILAGCTQAQMDTAFSNVAAGSAAIQAACADALPLANLAIGIPTIGPFVAAAVQIGCATDAGIQRLAADPSSAAWLGQQTQMLRTALRLR